MKYKTQVCWLPDVRSTSPQVYLAALDTARSWWAAGSRCSLSKYNGAMRGYSCLASEAWQRGGNEASLRKDYATFSRLKQLSVPTYFACTKKGKQVKMAPYWHEYLVLVLVKPATVKVFFSNCWATTHPAQRHVCIQALRKCFDMNYSPEKHIWCIMACTVRNYEYCSSQLMQCNCSYQQMFADRKLAI